MHGHVERRYEAMRHTMPCKRSRRFSRSWKAAVGCKSGCGITFPRFSPGLLISRFGPYSRCLGHPALLDSSDLGISVKSFCDQKHSFLFADKPPANDQGNLDANVLPFPLDLRFSCKSLQFLNRCR